MALDQINEYLVTATEIGENSFLDIDQFISGTTYESQKVPKSVLLAEVNKGVLLPFISACSDELTPLVVSNAVLTYRVPFAFNLTEVRASLTTSGTGETLLSVGINVNAVSIFSSGGTVITIDSEETTSTTATTPNVIGISAVPDDAEITIDILTIDGGARATGLKVSLIGNPT